MKPSHQNGDLECVGSSEKLEIALMPGLGEDLT